MERRDMPERELEQQLRAHFESEAERLRAPADMWERVRSRIAEQPSLSLRKGWSLGNIFRTNFTMRMAGAMAAVLILATAVAVPVLVGGGEEPPLVTWSGGSTGPQGAEGPHDDTGSLGEASAAAPTTPTPVPAMAMDAPPSESGSIAGAAGPSGLTERAERTNTPRPSPSGGRPGNDSTQPRDTTFEDYERQQFVDTARDNVSTFSLDTDRTSFALALNWAQQGYAVAPDSVRAEEWVNAFDYGYAKPPHGADYFAITSAVAGHPLDGSKHLVRLAFQAPEVVDDRPLNVTLVLDASGSMAEGNRVDIARAAAEAIRQGLRPRDRIAVVHFTDYVIDGLTVEHRRASDRDVQRSIGALEPHGATNVQAGLDLGVQLADRIRRERPDAWHYVILMSDGVANVDATNPFAILESAGDYDRENPLRLITIGVGVENYNDYLLEQLAQHGNGWYRYLDDVEQAQWTFSRENWLALAVPFADQTRAQVTWNADVVRAWRIVGYENRVTPDHTFQQNRKEFAEIPSGAATTVFYEVELWDADWRRGDAQWLGEVELRWVEPGSGGSRQQREGIAGRFYAADFDLLDDPMIQFGAIVALAADRYSGGAPSNGYDLELLWDHLERLERRLGHLDAYYDFRFLLEHLAEHATYIGPEPRPDTGYSR